MLSSVLSFFSSTPKKPVITSSPRVVRNASPNSLPERISQLRQYYSTTFSEPASVLEEISGLPLYGISNNPIKFESHRQDQVVKQDVQNVPGAFTLSNVLSKEECDQFIGYTENATQYDYAKISIGFNKMIEDRDTRNNRRVMLQVPPEMLDAIWERVQEHIPDEVNWTSRGQQLRFTKKGLNPRLRFYRYTENEYFAPHRDGCIAQDNERSWFSFLIYLNGSDGECTGGATTFFDHDRNQYSVTPETGKALLFYHGPHLDSPVHEGSLLEKGVKYVLRSDVMYELQEDQD